MSSKKAYDLVIFGASGFTGALVVRYLLSEAHINSELRWAIAGRDKKKLEDFKQKIEDKILSKKAKNINIPVIVAESFDEASLLKMVQSTRVVLTTVGPYRLYGELLVKLCAENGVHYCDLTGEIVWFKDMMNRYGKAAQRTGARIVSFCGYDAVPPDLTSLLMTNAIQHKFQSTTSKISYTITAVKGAISGGSVASIFTIMETTSSKEMKESSKPYYLIADEEYEKKEAQGKKMSDDTTSLLAYDSDLEKWTGISIFGKADRNIVHFSNFTLEQMYGHGFVFQERMALGGFIVQLITSFALVVFACLIYFKWTRQIMKRILPSPGQGPSEATMAQGFFVAHALGYKSDGQLAISANVYGNYDPGYGFTSRVITECALLMVAGDWNPQSKASKTGGFYTPASAFGTNLVKQLQEKNIMHVELREHVRF